MSQSIRVIQNRIENQLWSVVLPWVQDNKAAHWVISTIDQFNHLLRTPEFWVRSLLAASLGLWLGIGIGMIIAIIY